MSLQSSILLVATLSTWGGSAAHAALRPYAGPGLTVFQGDAVDGHFTGWGAGIGLDLAGPVLALGLAIDASDFHQGREVWVHTELLQLRVFLAKQGLRPYAEIGIGAGGDPALDFYAAGVGGGIILEEPSGPTYFLDVRRIGLGNMESSGYTTLVVRVGLMK